MAPTEFELISTYFDKEVVDGDLLLGIGDDAAVIQVPEKARIAISSDTLVESVHFPVEAPADLVARRALRVNLSDMAAMGATPRWFTLNLTLPEADPDWLATFSTALHEDAKRFGCTLIGGDTTRGALNIGIQIMGTIAEDAAHITRSGARDGDLLVVTGTLGDAAAALDYLDKKYLNSSTEYLVDRYWLPTPRVEFARRASTLINAACDISDGLAADAGHICKASGVGAELKMADLPLSSAILDVCENTAREKALNGGDDYELCMAVSPKNMDMVRALAKELDVRLTVAGGFTTSEGVICVDELGEGVPLLKSGYQHF